MYYRVTAYKKQLSVRAITVLASNEQEALEQATAVQTYLFEGEKVKSFDYNVMLTSKENAVPTLSFLKFNNLWKNILANVDSAIPTLEFDLYVRSLQPLGFYQNKLILGAENSTIKNVVENNYIEIVRASVSRIMPIIKDVAILSTNKISNVNDEKRKALLLPVLNCDTFLNIYNVAISGEVQWDFENDLKDTGREYIAGIFKATSAEDAKTQALATDETGLFWDEANPSEWEILVDETSVENCINEQIDDFKKEMLRKFLVRHYNYEQLPIRQPTLLLVDFL